VSIPGSQCLIPARSQVRGHTEGQGRRVEAGLTMDGGGATTAANGDDGSCSGEVLHDGEVLRKVPQHEEGDEAVPKPELT
jgi:hypothetical protein